MRKVKLLVAVLLVTVAGLVPTEATAGPVGVKELQRVSGASPFSKGCGGVLEDPTQSPLMHTEVEPHVAVNPTDPDNLVAAWIQDRFGSLGGGQSVVVGVSDDRGRSWSQALVPGISTCTDPDSLFTRATDPWLAFGPDGVVYLAVLSFPPLEPSTIFVSTSRDGGRTWSPTPSEATAGAQSAFNDKEALTAHPSIPGRAYMAWMKRVTLGTEAVVAAVFSSTRDHGQTWTVATPMFVAGARLMVAGSEILVLPDGVLVHVFMLGSFDEVVPFRVMAQRSTDDGLSWSIPREIGSGLRMFARDPDNSSVSINGPAGLPTADLAPDGTVYVAWVDLDSSPRRIVVARSSDGGSTWTDPRTLVSSPTDLLIPSLAVGHRGTVGVTYYDFTSDLPGDSELTTNVRFAHSDDGGGTWNGVHLAGPFDMRKAPISSGGPFLGDYTGLDAVPPTSNGSSAQPLETFAAAFSMAPPAAMTFTDDGSSDRQADVFGATIRISSAGK